MEVGLKVIPVLLSYLSMFKFEKIKDYYFLQNCPLCSVFAFRNADDNT